MVQRHPFPYKIDASQRQEMVTAIPDYLVVRCIRQTSVALYHAVRHCYTYWLDITIKTSQPNASSKQFYVNLFVQLEMTMLYKNEVVHMEEMI